ncbi:MAG: LLM class F420-dependent oxidoreductase [Pseudomonadales bacterium]|nr:LLM class F420-dependent oxidoreductase [Pseudomonadales bacterium]
MKLSVEYPSVAYREGPTGMLRLAKAIEEIGYDQLDIFDHVVMGFPTEDRPSPRYPPQMPIMEALVMLAAFAAVTSRIGLGTEILVLPQRQPVLVAKQVATLDILSAGRMRLGVGAGWQASEFEALDENFPDRGVRMDEAIQLLRTCWGESHVEFNGPHYRVHAMAMEPKPPRAEHLPIWIGGHSERALRRVGELGDGWLAPAMTDPVVARDALARIAHHAEHAERDPAGIGLQQMLDVPPRDEAGKRFYADLDQVEARALAVAEMGFGWGALNATAIFQSGARSVEAIIDTLAAVHDRLRRALGPSS